MENLSDHEKAILFTGLMMTMAEHIDQFTREEIVEMTSLSAKNRENFMANLEKDDSSKVVMILARKLSE